MILGGQILTVLIKTDRMSLCNLLYLLHPLCRHLPAALPYIGAYLDTIHSLEMASKTYNQDGLVNFIKMTKLAVLITTTLQFQDIEFDFDPRLEVSLCASVFLWDTIMCSYCIQ